MRRGLIFGRMHMQRHPLPTYQLKPDYPVLAPLSRSYPKSKGRLPTRYSPVRHSTQGRSPFLVRLACVRHAASVHSEPESNSPVMYNCRATLLLFINLIKSEFYLLQLAIYLSKILAFPARGERLYGPSFSPSSFFLSFFNSPSRSALRKGRVMSLTLSSNPGQLLFYRCSLVFEYIKKVLATTYFPTSGLAVSLALEVLTSEFGMESGVAPPPWSPGRNI